MRHKDCNDIPTVYLLQHCRERDAGDEDVKVIGIYSTKEAAEAAIKRLASKPGFGESISGFHIDAYQMNEDHWGDGFA